MRRLSAAHGSLPTSALAEIKKLVGANVPAHSSGGLSIHLAELDHYAVGCESPETANILATNLGVGLEQTNDNPYMPQLVDRFETDDRVFLVVYWPRAKDTDTSEDDIARELFSIANKLVHNRTDVVVRWCKAKAEGLTRPKE